MAHPLITRLRARRRAMRIRQSVLADRIGYSEHTISNAERGASSPTIDFVEAYATALGMNLTLADPGNALDGLLAYAKAEGVFLVQWKGAQEDWHILTDAERGELMREYAAAAVIPPATRQER